MSDPAPAPPEGARGVFWRMAAVYAFAFSQMGVFVPYWPLWLADRGLGADELSLVIAAGMVVRTVVTPAWGRLADARGERRRLLMLLYWLAFGSVLLFVPAHGFWPLLAASLAWSALVPAQMALTDNVGVLASYQYRLDYGRIRLWGSLSFIAATLAAGPLIGLWGPQAVLWAMLACFALAALSAGLLPDLRTPRAARPQGAVLHLLRQPVFLVFLAATLLINGSHALYYAFAALYWRGTGLSETTIGILWSLGVVAEVCVFAASGWITARVGPARLILLGGLACAIRWSALAFTTEVPVIALVQVLHALTFGAAHLGAMHFLARWAPLEFSATALGLYSAAVTLGTALIAAPSGTLYSAAGGHAFLVMAGLGAVAVLCALVLTRLWRGERLAAA
ncbi:MFS transporter [Zavarzinia sp. CC-PAN008]|uniref:MFS transporter n=1 Tax=Zavarzinia sp. CC-PAN008 TaxID=3243332 RepID=UPI003F7489E3